MEHFDALMVGAGLFNAVLAAKLTEAGKKVLVIDRRAQIGGNCATYEDGGITIHKYGAHIFHTSDREAWEFANKYDEFVPFVNSPVALASRGKDNFDAFNLPFNMNTFSKLWGITKPETAKRKITEQTSTHIKDTYANLEEKALSLVGDDIYEMFIKHYTERQWGCKCTELDPEIITRIPLRFTYDNNYFNDTWQGIPRNGYSKWIANMLSGAEVILGVDYLASREYWDSKADKVFYSGMLDEYFNYSKGDLPYRSLEFAVSHLSVGNFQGVAVVNYTHDGVDFTRSIEHKNFTPWNKELMESNHTIVSYEYPKAFARGGEAYYPVKNSESESLYWEYRHMLPEHIEPTGRLGLYRYNDMDDTIILARYMAEKLIGK